MCGVYNNDDVALMRSALDEAWDALSADKRASVLRSDMACRMLDAAAKGERDPVKLKEAALRMEVA
jgi:hypothetical protein